MAVLGFTLPPDSGEKLSLGKISLYIIWVVNIKLLGYIGSERVILSTASKYREDKIKYKFAVGFTRSVQSIFDFGLLPRYLANICFVDELHTKQKL